MKLTIMTKANYFQFHRTYLQKYSVHSIDTCSLTPNRHYPNTPQVRKQTC